MHVEFIGFPSGDGESFCWDVSRETFVRVVGREPGEDDGAVFHMPERLYRLYPENLPLHGGYTDALLRVVVSVEPALRHHYAAVKPDTGGTGNDGR